MKIKRKHVIYINMTVATILSMFLPGTTFFVETTQNTFPDMVFANLLSATMIVIFLTEAKTARPKDIRWLRWVPLPWKAPWAYPKFFLRFAAILVIISIVVGNIAFLVETFYSMS